MFPEKKLLKHDKKIVLLNQIRQDQVKKEEKKLPLVLKGYTPGMSIHFASCCNPIPGDNVIAFILEGKGLILHLNVCDNLKKEKKQNKKMIDISWDYMIFK